MKTFTSACILSVALIFVVGCGSKSTPANVGSAPKSAASAPAQPSTPPTVVFIGDSITYNWGQSWASPDFAQHPEWTDAGVIGNDSGQAVDRFQTDVIDRHPDVVLINIGTNDVYGGSWVFDGGLSNWNTVQNIAYMVSQAQANGIKPILATIAPWNCADAVLCALATKADPSPQHWANIDQLNQWIRQYGFENNIPVVDFHSVLVSADGKTYQPSLCLDGVHPSPAGYALMTPLVEAAINQAAD